MVQNQIRTENRADPDQRSASERDEPYPRVQLVIRRTRPGTAATAQMATQAWPHGTPSQRVHEYVKRVGMVPTWRCEGPGANSSHVPTALIRVCTTLVVSSFGWLLALFQRGKCQHHCSAQRVG